MKFILSTAIIVSLLFTKNVEARWKPTPGMTWNYVLGDDNFNVHSEKAQVIDVDYNKSASTIQEYHNAGKKVICYFSGGTLEKHRKDFAEYKKVDGLVRNKYEEWSDENWLDIRKEGLKPLIRSRMKEAVSKNCDGLEVDNLDGFQQSEVQSWSNPLTKADTITFAKWLGNTAHELGISIGLKNALFMINEVGGYFDFAINESCATLSHPECHLYKPFLSEGKAVFGVSYESRMSGNTDLCSSLNGINISMIVKKDQYLRQEGYIFDGKSECGSSFKTGSSGSSTSTSNSNSSSSNSSNSNSSSSNSSNSNSSSSNTSTSNISSNSGSSGSSGSSNSGISVNNQPNKTTIIKTATVVVKGTGASNNPINNAAVNNAAVSDAAAVSNKDPTTTNNSTDNTNNKNDKNDIKEKEIIDPDGSSEKSGSNTGTIITGLAVTGSVAGAAGVLLFIKKNPRKYEDLKRNLTRKASSVKRTATSVTRKLTTKKPKRTNYNDSNFEYYDIDALNNMNDNPFNNYRYQFTKNINY
jgi:hypothetical protein